MLKDDKVFRFCRPCAKLSVLWLILFALAQAFGLSQDTLAVFALIAGTMGFVAFYLAVCLFIAELRDGR